MPRVPKPSPKVLPDNALAKSALLALQQIEEEAKMKKREHLEALLNAKQTLMKQLEEIDAAINKLNGAPAGRRPRRDLEEVRVRVLRWMSTKPGEKFGAGDLMREFPELEGVVVGPFLKPLIEEGKVKADLSAGIRRPKYFI